MAVRVGTSGWAYDDWEGRVFPRGLPAAERLRFYATHFPTVEVNSTYYRDPAPAVVRGWAEKARDVPGFELSVKASGTLTHEAMVDGAPSEVARVAEAWRALVADPLADAHRLGAVLLQLSPAVTHREPALERLDAALRALAPHAVAVEFRNRTWHDETPALRTDALALLDAHNAAAVVVDGPPFPPIVAGEADHAFVRFHGRNAERWFREDRYHGERYDYLYSAEELDPWAKRLAALAREKRDVRVYFNNHVEGKGFRNGVMMEEMLEREGAPLVRASSPQRRLPF